MSSTNSRDPFFLREAEASLAAFRGRPAGRLHATTRLKNADLSLSNHTFRLHPTTVLTADSAAAVAGDLLALALAYPAASDLEVLRVHGHPHRPRLASSLPCAATLRVLDLDHCRCDLDHGPLLAFPQLTDLRLRGCIVSPGYLQAVLAASPALTTLAVTSLTHESSSSRKAEGPDAPGIRSRVLCLRLRSATVETVSLGLEPYHDAGVQVEIELEAPSLRSFRYTGFAPVEIVFSRPPTTTTLERVDLDFASFGSVKSRDLCRVLGSFSATRALSLRLQCIEDIAGDGGTLPTFPNLEALQVDPHHWHSKDEEAAPAMARLLGSCPAMAELHLRLKLNQIAVRGAWPCAMQASKKDRAPRLSFAVSMDRFNKLSSSRDSNTMREPGEMIPAELAALKSSAAALGRLRKATLRFEASGVEYCGFQVQLARFLAENAMGLEEMHVGDGSQKFWPDHLFNRVKKSRADSFRRKDMPDSGGFRVYPAAYY